MFTKILIVSLVQVALARHVPNMEYNAGRQFRNSGSFEVHNLNYSDGNRSGRHEPYVENNNRTSTRNGSERGNNYEIQTHDRPEATTNSQNVNRRDHHIQGLESQKETNSENSPMNHSSQRNHHRNMKQKRSARFELDDSYYLYISQKDNLDTQSNVSDSSFNQTTEYNSQDTNSSYYQKTQGNVKTNEKTNNNSYDSRIASQPAKTNLNVHSGFNDTQKSNNSLSEVRGNGDSMIFIDIDNPKPNGPVKTTTDNELRYNTNEDDKEEKWVWGVTSTVQATTNPPNKTEMVSPGSDLDDRTSFNGDACPKGQAKVLGQCVDKH